MDDKEKILVTKTFLPPFEEYMANVKRAWDARWITNNGSLARELEKKLQEYLGVKHAIFVTNGTLALQLAIRSLDLKKEIITTPFTFVATATSILWENCTPVFVDIDPKTFSIDVTKIEKAITKNTQAIMAVHVYGYPCDVEAIEKIAKKHNLKVIYDAAHAFGVEYKGKSLLTYGDVTMLSLHATKLYHTGEGGLLVTNNDETARKIRRLRDFGFHNDKIVEVGINAKNTELHAAMGLTNLKYVDRVKNQRGTLIREYRRLLEGTKLHDVRYLNSVTYNHSYFPVVFKTETDLILVKKALEQQNIFPRRYFYPSLNTLPFVTYTPCPVSESISTRVLCLPLYNDLSLQSVRKIVKIITETIAKNTVSVTVGIPAYNESKNIKQLIKSILSQTQENYSLREIIVNCDGSTDRTSSLVKHLAKNDKRIKVMESKVRRGKTYRLNQLYTINSSDYLLTLDADILLRGNDEIEKMVQVFKNDAKVVVAAANVLPVRSRTLMGKIIFANNILWNHIRENINGGDHIANLYGNATMLKKEFSKSFVYPTHLTCDEEYLYIKAKELNGFRFVKNAYVLFKAPETLSDFIMQGKRYLNERKFLVNIFSKDIVKLHNIPIRYKFEGIIKTFLSNPLYVFFAITLNIIVKVYPYNDALNADGMWEIAYSTKTRIDLHI